MAIGINGNHAPIIRDERFGKGCEVETECRSGEWALAFKRYGDLVFRVNYDKHGDSFMSFAEALLHTAEADVYDFINAEKTDGRGNDAIVYLQKRIEDGSWKVARTDFERRLVRTWEQAGDGEWYSVLKTYRGRLVLKIKHQPGLRWMDHQEIARIVESLGPYFNVFVDAKRDRDHWLDIEEELLRYEYARSEYIKNVMLGVIEYVSHE